MEYKKILFEKRLYNFIDRIQVSKKRRAKYFKKGDKIPKKYQNKEYIWNNNGILSNIHGIKPIKNPIAAGTPKFIKISGQDIWRGIPYHTRSAIAKALKKYFYEEFVRYMKPLDVKDYPIGVEMIFYDVVDGEDLNNQEYFYKKSLGDALAGNVHFIRKKEGQKIILVPDYSSYPKKIQDDSKEFIQEYYTKFIPITEHKDRSLLIKIYKI